MKTARLRKAAAARLAEAGCTDRQIMAITGHRTAKEVDRYTRAAQQKVLAAEAIGKLTKARAGLGIVPPVRNEILTRWVDSPKFLGLVFHWVKHCTPKPLTKKGQKHMIQTIIIEALRLAGCAGLAAITCFLIIGLS